MTAQPHPEPKGVLDMTTVSGPTTSLLRNRLKAREATGGTGGGKMPLRRQVLLQAVCLFVGLTVLFPVFWVTSLALDPRDLSRPDGLNLIPPGASLDNFREAIEQPTSNPVSFWQLALNSFMLAVSTSVFSVLIGVFAAYVFSRLHFTGRAFLMLAVLAVLMLPAVATIAPLFILLNQVQIGDFNLRQSLLGVGLAVISGLLPFAIWNLKGYLDTIPKDLEEAAHVDGATRNQAFFKVILPLAMPALAVTAFLGFIAGWTEFYFSVTFLIEPQTYTLSVALNGMVGQFATTTPWGKFSAFAILFALPVSLVYVFFQRWIVGGLAIGGVKG
jgi:arabinogalactan oligomer/maltooligosaccharide transport system permease protein